MTMAVSYSPTRHRRRSPNLTFRRVLLLLAAASFSPVQGNGRGLGRGLMPTKQGRGPCRIHPMQQSHPQSLSTIFLNRYHHHHTSSTCRQEPAVACFRLHVRGGATDEDPPDDAANSAPLLRVREAIHGKRVIRSPHKRSNRYSDNHQATVTEHATNKSTRTRPSLATRRIAVYMSSLTTALASLLLPKSHSFHSKLAVYYLWALVGTSVVWHLFFYLLSVGYALGIGLPCTVAMLTHGRRTRTITPHAFLVVLWSARLTVFLLWREYVAWPAWHVRLRQVAAEQQQKWTTSPAQRQQDLLVTAGSWLVYTALYWCMALPVLSRLLASNKVPSHSSSLRPAFLSSVALTLQVVGLGMETVADLQKAAWKRKAPHVHCRVGMWRYLTHPNYLGEWIFWCGTYLSGLTGAPWPVSLFPPQKSIVSWTCTTLAMTLGLCFISTVLYGAVHTLDAAQYTKYASYDPDYLTYRARTTMWGPRWSWPVGRRLDETVRGLPPAVHNTTTTNTTSGAAAENAEGGSAFSNVTQTDLDG